MKTTLSSSKFIAEVCSNHNGNLKRALKFVDFAKNSGFYAIKFQLFKINKLFSKDAKKLFKTAQKKIKRELPKEFIPIISKYCKKKKIKFSCTPFDLHAVEYLKKYVDFYKIASYEMAWPDLLKACAQTKKPVILSTGMSSLKEVKKSYDILKKNKCKKISLLHCVSSYPANVKSCNLNSIKFLKNKFNCEVGWSDHTVNDLLIYSAVRNQKADYIELHIDIDGKGWENIGSQHCWSPYKIKNLMEYLNNEKKINGSHHKKISKEENRERKYRADPLDGLRPMKSFRHIL